jgi:hypothetical protein
LKFPDYTPLFDYFKNPELINDEEIEKEFERTKKIFNRRLEEIYNKGGVKKFQEKSLRAELTKEA